jgi:hypothetical protein
VIIQISKSDFDRKLNKKNECKNVEMFYSRRYLWELIFYLVHNKMNILDGSVMFTL